MIRRLLLIILFLLAQTGALAHGISHAAEHEHEGLDHEAACELCLAYAPLGAGMASTPLAWAPPAADFHLHAALPSSVFPSFQPLYLSRAPPL
jgi:hypothetical protein